MHSGEPFHKVQKRVMNAEWLRIGILGSRRWNPGNRHDGLAVQTEVETSTLPRRDPRPSQTQVAARRHQTPSLILPGSGRCHQVGTIVGGV